MWSTIRILVMFSANNCSPTNGTSLTSWWPFLVHLFHDRANVLVPRMSAGENGQTSYWTTKSCVKSERSVSNRINISVVKYLRLASKQLPIVPLIILITMFYQKALDHPKTATKLLVSCSYQLSQWTNLPSHHLPCCYKGSRKTIAWFGVRHGIG